MVELIKENQYRIAFILIALTFIILFGYLLFLVNINQDLTNNQKIFLDIFLAILIYFVYKEIKPLVKQIWKQIDIRDDIEKQTKIKLELENLKLMKELGLKIDKKKLSEDVKFFIEKAKKI